MKRINFDHLAASVILSEVKEAILPFLGEDFGNPLSRHFFGERPRRKALEEARVSTAGLINVSSPEEIIFTSCGSEANNLALKGIAGAYAKKRKTSCCQSPRASFAKLPAKKFRETRLYYFLA